MKKPFSVRTILLAGSLLLQLSTLCFHSRGAAGDVDLSFDPGSGVTNPVSVVVVQPDGKVLIGGPFTFINGTNRYGNARLNADGSLDSTFISDSFNSAFGPVYPDFGSRSPGDDDYVVVGGVAVQSDGKVIVGGVRHSSCFGVENDGCQILFSTFVIRLNPNGSLDDSFISIIGRAELSLEETVQTVALQPDGKVLVSFGGPGGYGDPTGFGRLPLIRLNANGTRDTNFNSSIGQPGSLVTSVAPQADGKLLIGGAFNITINGTNRYGLARLNSNGSLDHTFNPAVGGYPLALQSDGKVLIGGYARLNADGSLDSTFNPGTGANGVVRSIAVQADGKVLVGGSFTTVNGTHRDRIARLNSDGSLDGSFSPGRGLDGPVAGLAVQPDGKVLIGGVLTFIKGTNRYGDARLNADGSLDSTFISSSFNPDLPNLGSTTNEYDSTAATTVAVQPDGKILVGGASTHYYNCDPFEGACSVYTIYFVTRLNLNGSRDTNFTGTGAVGHVSSIAVQSDGKVLVGSDAFTAVKIVRLNADGSLDTGFNPGTGPNGSISSVASQADGKVLIGGYFTAVNGVNRTNIARLNADGSVDSSFNPGTEADGTVRSITLQPDGKVLIGGSFTTVNGTNRNHIARLNANGSLDSSFNPGTGADGTVHSIALQSDGNVLIGGAFFTVNGVVRRYVARLYGDSFAPPSLNIVRSNAFVIVSWPSPSIGFVLQQNTDLNPAHWTAPSETVTDNGSTKSISAGPTPGHRFYRLFKP